jgi:hypothetical protein
MGFREGNRETVFRHTTIRNAFVIFQSPTVRTPESGYIAYCAGRIGIFSDSLDAQTAVYKAINKARDEGRLTTHLVLKAAKDA